MLGRTARITLFFSLVLSFLSLVSYGSQEFFPFLGEMKNSRVNVRSGPSENFERLCQLDQGDPVIVLERNFSWYKIRLPKQAKSFVSDKYVLVEGQEALVTASDVNVRAGAGIQYSIIGRVDKGQKLRVLDHGEQWYQVEPVESLYGYVAAGLVNFKSNDLAAYRDPQVAAQEKATAAALVPVEEQPPVPVNVVSVRGVLQLEENPSSGEKFYSLVAEGQMVYDLNGPDFIFKDFVNERVDIEGKLLINEDTSGALDVLKIQRVL
jgi:uncharacterized protein YraI